MHWFEKIFHRARVVRFARFTGARTALVAGSLLLGGFALAQTQNSTTTYGYDAQGNLTTITNPNSQVTTQKFDALNRAYQTILPVPATGGTAPVIKVTYDGQDRTTSVTDPRILATNYTVDGLGNLTTLASPDTGTTTKTYDVAGNVLTSTDARGKKTTFSYDVLNRVALISYPTGTATTFTYDGGASPLPFDIGHLTQISDESGSTRLQYDAFGNVIQKTQISGSGTSALTQIVQYQFGTSGSTNGKLTGLIYPTGSTVNYTYDAAGRVASMTVTPGGGAATTLLSGISYVPFGAAKAWTWGNGTPYARTFDLDGRMTSFPLGALSGSNPTPNALTRNVNYDPASRILSYTHADAGGSTTSNVALAANQSFAYDNLDRLTGYAPATTSQTYSYDNTGNRIALSIGASSYTYSIDPASNKLTSTSGPAAKTNIYDAAGNLTSDGTNSYTYSDRGRRATATVGANAFGYLYNGLGQRVMKSGPTSFFATGSVRYLYDEKGHLLGEYDGTGKPMQETVYLGDTPITVLLAE